MQRCQARTIVYSTSYLSLGRLSSFPALPSRLVCTMCRMAWSVDPGESSHPCISMRQLSSTAPPLVLGPSYRWGQHTLSCSIVYLSGLITLKKIGISPPPNLSSICFMCFTLGTERGSTLDWTLGSSVGMRMTRPCTLSDIFYESCQMLVMEEYDWLVEEEGY